MPPRRYTPALWDTIGSMPKLTSLIPSRFAQECASNEFLGSCRGLLAQLAEADSLKAALGVFGGAAVGPLALVGIYAGGAFLQWKADARKEEAAKARFREVYARLGRIEQGVNEQKELAGLLDELLKRDGDMRERLERAELVAKSPEAAFESMLHDTLTKLAADTDESFDGVRIFLSNISVWVVEGFERVEAGQAVTHEKLDANAAQLAEVLRRLDAIESVPAQMSVGSDAPPERPPLSGEDRALLDAVKPFADALTRYRIAVAEGDDEGAGELEPEVERLRDRQRADEDFLFERARGDRHFYADRDDEAIGHYRAALRAKPEEPSVHNNLAGALLRSRRSEDHGAALTEAEWLLSQALELRRAAHPGDHPDIASSLNNLAFVWQSLGRAAEAEAVYVEALKMTQRLFEGDHPNTAKSLNNLASVRELLGRAAEAETIYEQALAMYKNLFEGDHPDIALSLNNLAGVRQSLGRAAEAELLVEQALAMYQNLFEGDHPDIALSLNNLAAMRESMGRAAEAESLYEQALAMQRRLFEGDHPDIALSLNNLAAVRQSLGRVAEAEPLYEQTLAMYQNLFESDHPDIALSLNNLAFVRQSLGRAAEAETLYEQALVMYQNLFENDHPDIASSLNNLASVRQSLGRAAEAEAVYVEALKMIQRLFEGDHPNTAKSLNNLATCRGTQGKFREALPLHEQAMAMAGRCLPEGHPDRVLCEKNLAFLRARLGGK